MAPTNNIKQILLPKKKKKSLNAQTSVKTQNPFSHSSVLQNQNPNATAEKKKKDEIGGSRKLGIGPALTVVVERRNERGREQEVREKKQSMNEEKKNV